MEAEKDFGSDSDIDGEQLKQLYSQILAKKKTDRPRSITPEKRSRSRSRDLYRRGANRVQQQKKEDPQIERFRLFQYEPTTINLKSVPEKIKTLPVFKKSNQILNTILNNQIVLITGETGCGKSTQIPRILYEYINTSKLDKKILCVQPRRLAAINLQRILSKQIPCPNVVSYHIAMQNTIKPSTKILFMTNGIFLQRFIHDHQELINQFPFIILDEVHERDIDTDFILLSMKHVVRKNPKLRVILMSATVDNGLFQYYFSDDHITKFMNEQNIYLRCLKIEGLNKKKKKDERSDSQDSQHNRIQQAVAMDFMNSKKPCPSIMITEQGAFTKEYYYLETLERFFKRPIQIQWANTFFNQKLPTLMKQMIMLGAQLIDEIFERSKSQQHFSVLVFLPGLIEIQMFCNQVFEYCSKQYKFDVIQLHSTTLNSQISSQLNDSNPPRPRLIVATNIAESSITVMGVKYIIDFCLSKQVRFNYKTRLENLEMIWSSQASSEQRAGRTGRVCNGFVFRLIEEQFFYKLPRYSTPQIQRCSLDRLILRIKLLHQNEISKNSPNPIFSDPGLVLGRAIQPPSLKNIDASIKSLIFNGGLELINQQFHLTDLGRLYIDLPVDIIYSRMLLMSMIFNTLDDIIILVTLLQQAKNPFKKVGIQKRYMDYWEMIQSSQMCDFYGMVQIYKNKEKIKYKNGPRAADSIQNISMQEIKIHQADIQKRLVKLKMFKNRPVYKGDEKLRFKLTIWASFLDNAMRVVLPSHDEKQQKRRKMIISKNIPLEKTLVVNSTILKKHKLHENSQNFIKEWKTKIQKSFRLQNDPANIVLDYSQSYIMFNSPLSLMKILFCKSAEQVYGSQQAPYVKKQEQPEHNDNQKHLNFSIIPRSKNINDMSKMLNDLGDLELIQKGEVMDMYSNRKVVVDSFSVNRVISVNQKTNLEYLVTNSKVQRTSGSYCRYTSMLPNQLGLYQLLLLIFYPYLSIKADDKNNYYDIIRLRKKTKIKIGFILTNKDIQQINQVRHILRKFLCLQGEYQREDILSFWPKLKQIIQAERHPVIDERRWQKLFFTDIKYTEPEQMAVQTKQNQLKYMSPVQSSHLRKGYFSFQYLSFDQYTNNIARYNEWKLKVLKQLSDLKEFIWNTETHIACNRCHLKIGRLRDVGVINNVMRSFVPLPNSIKQAQFNQMDDEFCSLLMAFDFSDFEVQSCINNHILAIKIGNPGQFKILQFSGIQLIFPDQSRQQADFDKLDMRNYTTKSNKAMSNKRNLSKQITCKICQQDCSSVSEMEKHLKTWMHDQIVKQFKLSIQS